MTCPDDDTLVALVEHALPPATLVELEAHVDDCAACRQVIASLAQGSGIGTGTGTVHARGDTVQLAAGSRPALPPELDVDPSGARGFAPGSTIAGRYEIDSVLGRGGMAIVYLARDTTLARTVALKVHRGGAEHARLQQEAVAMARLAHPNVVTVFEVGDADGRRFVAMEYVRGGTLRDWLAASERDWRAIVALLVEVGGGIVAAHRSGLVHRDFKPENVLVDTDGRPRVSDFGLVQADAIAIPREDADVRAAPALSALTVTGAVVGTPAYMAPEQLAGELVDGRCDQFAFCVTLWEALYGRRPFPGATLAAIHDAIARGELAPPDGRRAVPARVRRVLERGLAARVHDRYPDMPALLAALRSAARSRAPRWIALGAAIAVVGGGGAAWATHVVHARAAVAACDAEVARVTDVVGPFARARLSAAFAATHVTYAADAAARAGHVLARVGDTLATATRTACTADEPAPIARARHACLAEHVAALRGVVAALDRADADTVEGAASAAWSLVETAPCADERALLAAPSAPSASSAAAADVDTDALVQARALLATGRYPAGLVLAQPLLAAARARGDRAAELTAELVIADLDERAGSGDAALPLLGDAIAAAEAQGRDRDAVHALELRASIRGDDHEFGPARQDLELVRAKLARLGGHDPAVEADVWLTESQVDIAEAKLADAKLALEHSIELDQQAYGADHPRRGLAYGVLSQVLAGQGHTPDAVDAGRHALAILEPALGDDHPMIAGALMTVAQGLITLGQLDGGGPSPDGSAAEGRRGYFDDARGLLVRAEAIDRRTLGDNHPARAQVLDNLGDLELAQHHAAAARADYEQALAIVEATGGADGGFAGSLHNSLAGAATLDHRDADALAEGERSLAILEKALGPDDTELAGTLEGLARSQLALGHAAAALPLAERALALTISQAGFDPALAADTESVVADALWATGDRAAARARLAAADARLGASDEVAPIHAAIATWLAAHPARGPRSTH